METIRDWWRGRIGAIDARHRDRASGFAREVRHSFLEHPKETGENFGQHLWFTTRTAFDLMLCGVILLIHGLLPFTFPHTVSDRMARINEVLRQRAARVAQYKAGHGRDI